ncbi:Oidioi.mRNA.OKI2018_I69.chr1.g914.t1.cds [Oikopleura dioica]|uniref:Oidioi.mRNA.OKI2018_I69.chr1.g914.t1.cds n=1 Tax=Oikopleura dioica TaxID=34765 RepID=A0ABN7SQ57_OIKDI|nr:Oidioi.mRNA.OKI2018_I69.chr1.g914.t1.cds [Oikopleura dioica]
MKLFSFFAGFQAISAQTSDCTLESFDVLKNDTTTDYVNCDGGILKVSIPECLLENSGLDKTKVLLGDKNSTAPDTRCNGAVENVNGTDTGNFIFDNCAHVAPTLLPDPENANKTELVFQTSLFTDERADKVIGDISRKYGLDLDLKCIVKTEQTLSLGDKAILTKENYHRVVLEDKVGNFEVSVGVYDEEGSVSFDAPVDATHVFVIPKEVFLQFEIENAGTDYELLVKQCTATSFDKTHMIIDNYCPIMDNGVVEDDTVAFLTPSPPSKTRLKFASFKFTDQEDEIPIDIECTVVICGSSSDCTLNTACGSTSIRRRRFAQTEMEVTESHIVQARINVF